MSTKLRIRIGEVEIDYEGTEEFLGLQQNLWVKIGLDRAIWAEIWVTREGEG